MSSSFLPFMRYHYQKPDLYFVHFGETYYCDHPVYNACTLVKIGSKGLGIIQQRFNPVDKTSKWGPIDPWLIDELYMHDEFKSYFDDKAGECQNGLYPTVSVRQIMWALKMKPIKRERWETVFDRKYV